MASLSAVRPTARVSLAGVCDRSVPARSFISPPARRCGMYSRLLHLYACFVVCHVTCVHDRLRTRHRPRTRVHYKEPESTRKCPQAPASARKRPQVSKVPEPYQTYGPAKMKTVNVFRESHAGGKNRYHTERNVTPSRRSSDHPNSERVHPPDARIVLQQHPTHPALRLTRLTLYIVDTHIASCASPARALASPLDRA